MQRYGFDIADWEAAKSEGKQVLAEYARRRQMITYTDFVARIRSISLEPHDLPLAALLGEISREEEAAGRGMLSALVVHKVGDYQPGPGFFELARELGHKVKDVEKFWIQQVKLIFEAWSGTSD
jgi:hypothetical protein